MRRFIAVLTLVTLSFPTVSGAQANDETLADIRQELSVLYVELRKLKRELNTTGSAAQLSAGGTLLDRVNAIESALQRLTAKTEQLEHRVQSVAEDGANRIGDLEFRLCELEADCDIATLEEGSTLGGIATGPSAGMGGGEGAGGADGQGGASGADADMPQLAVSEEADFESAKSALDAGEYAQAAEQFATFQRSYPGGPLTARAGLLRGEALEKSGQLKEAARAYLDTFSADQSGPDAPLALTRLGSALGQLGQVEQACVTLSEVGNRFPDSEAVSDARATMSELGCQ
ncbi:MAG: tol-pal system protein YbgF [Roseovarius sp.]